MMSLVESRLGLIRDRQSLADSRVKLNRLPSGFAEALKEAKVKKQQKVRSMMKCWLGIRFNLLSVVFIQITHVLQRLAKQA